MEGNPAPGEVKYDNGVFYQWTGDAWRHVTPAERDKAAWDASRHGTVDPFREAARRAQESP